MQQPTGPSKQPIRARYLGHVTGHQPISDQYFLNRSVPVTMISVQYLTLLFRLRLSNLGKSLTLVLTLISLPHSTPLTGPVELVSGVTIMLFFILRLRLLHRTQRQHREALCRVLFVDETIVRLVRPTG